MRIRCGVKAILSHRTQRRAILRVIHPIILMRSMRLSDVLNAQRSSQKMKNMECAVNVAVNCAVSELQPILNLANTRSTMAVKSARLHVEIILATSPLMRCLIEVSIRKQGDVVSTAKASLSLKSRLRMREAMTRKNTFRSNTLTAKLLTTAWMSMTSSAILTTSQAR